MPQKVFANFICDKAIIGITEGDINALSDIYDCMGKQIYFMAYSILKNHHDAEDVLQQVLYEIVKDAHAYRKGSNAKAWIFSIARNQALKVLRNRKSFISFDNFENNEDYATDDQSLMSSLTMFDALRVLSDEDQQIVLLRINSYLKFNEISEMLNITTASAEKKYQRAIKKLKAYYHE